jgi:polar amino acid transport system permease protein
MSSSAAGNAALSTAKNARWWLWTLVLWLAVSAALYLTFLSVKYQWNWEGVWRYRVQILNGWLATLGISLAAMLVCVIIAFLLMIGRRAKALPVRLLCGGVVEFVRGMPLLVLLLIGYYVIANALKVDQRILVGVLLLGLFEGAYLSEIFRGAVDSIGASQREAARAVGFDTAQTYRFVIIPQALRRALPGTTGQLVSLIKDSSLLSVIGVEELTKKVQIANAATYTGLEGFIPLALAYLAVTLPLSWSARQLERRFAYET